MGQVQYAPLLHASDRGVWLLLRQTGAKYRRHLAPHRRVEAHHLSRSKTLSHVWDESAFLYLLQHQFLQ